MIESAEQKPENLTQRVVVAAATAVILDFTLTMIASRIASKAYMEALTSGGYSHLFLDKILAIASPSVSFFVSLIAAIICCWVAKTASLKAVKIAAGIMSAWALIVSLLSRESLPEMLLSISVTITAYFVGFKLCNLTKSNK